MNKIKLSYNCEIDFSGDSSSLGKPGIYLIFHPKSLANYVGSDHCLGNRFQDHLYNCRNGKANVKMQRRWDEDPYFVFRVLETVSDTTRLLILEQKWMDYWMSWEFSNMNVLRTSSLDASNREPTTAALVREKFLRSVRSPEQSQRLRNAALNLSNEEKEERSRKLSQAGIALWKDLPYAKMMKEKRASMYAKMSSKVSRSIIKFHQDHPEVAENHSKIIKGIYECRKNKTIT